MTIRFLVVEELTAYNLIFGRPTLNECKAVIIPALMLLKYEKDDGTVLMGTKRRVESVTSRTSSPRP